MPETHALLSPSAAHRWMHCTASPTAEAMLPDPGSPYAAEGTLAHAIAELKLRKAFVKPMGPKKFAGCLKKIQEDPAYNPEMLPHTDAYLDYIEGIVHGFPSKPYVAAEARLDLSSIAPDCFGTADCLIIGGKDLHVIDFKYGKGKQVDAEENPQLRLYGIGAVLANSLFYDIHTVHLHIFQPRLDHVSTETIDRDELMDWGVFQVKPKAEEAHNGPGEYRAGDWCQFCRAKGRCQAQAKQMLDGVQPYREQDPCLMGNGDYAALLPQLSALKAWIGQVEDAALHRLLNGEEITGFKLVEGRSVRQWRDQDAAFDALTAAGYDRDLLYVRTPLTLSATEKLVGKTKFSKLVGEYVLKPPGAPTVAPASDRRPPYTTTPTPQEAFEN